MSVLFAVDKCSRLADHRHGEQQQLGNELADRSRRRHLPQFVKECMGVIDRGGDAHFSQETLAEVAGNAIASSQRCPGSTSVRQCKCAQAVQPVQGPRFVRQDTGLLLSTPDGCAQNSSSERS